MQENIVNAITEFSHSYILELKDEIKKNYENIENSISNLEDVHIRRKFKLTQQALLAHQKDFIQIFENYSEQLIILEGYTQDFLEKFLKIEKILNNLEKYQQHIFEFQKLNNEFRITLNEARTCFVKMTNTIDDLNAIGFQYQSCEPQQLIEKMAHFNKNLLKKIKILMVYFIELNQKIHHLKELEPAVEKLAQKIHLK